ncbi:MAG: hypothetical protein JWP31_2619 [Aeromicrobium sp.]|nr:hypothetical protein [Aeromicrobium sp.]
MIKKQIVGVIFAGSIVAGVGAGAIANALVSDGPAAAAPSQATSATPTSGPTSPAATSTAPTESDVTVKGLTIRPGALGPVNVGMSKADALATGLFDADVPAPVDGCEASPLAWKAPFDDEVDVQSVGNGEIVSLGVKGASPRTPDGLGVGSTFAEVRASLDDDAPVEAGYGQTGLFDYDPDTGRWVGYLFASAPDDVAADDPVVFVEVTKGAQPGLMRDGC